jgi:hypothetical protein
MTKIKATKKGQISFGDNSPNVQGKGFKFTIKNIDTKSFLGGLITGILSSLIAAYIWSLI